MKLSLVTAITLALPASAHAASFTVCKRLLNGSCSFQTIQSAIDATTDGDTLFVLMGTYEESLVIDHDLEIRGLITSQFDAVVQGDGTQPVLTVREGATVRLFDLVLTQGGGFAGIANAGTLVMQGCSVTDIHAEYGAILNEGTLNLGGETQVTDNVGTGFFGGAVTNIYGSVTIKGGSVIAGNEGRLGGGICNLLGIVDLKKVHLASNHARAAGGAWMNMYAEGTVIESSRVTYDLNSAEGSCARFSDPNASPSCMD